MHVCVENYSADCKKKKTEQIGQEQKCWRHEYAKTKISSTSLGADQGLSFVLGVGLWHRLEFIAPSDMNFLSLLKKLTTPICGIVRDVRYVCVRVCMYVCVYVCMYILNLSHGYACFFICMRVCLSVCIVCVFVCVHVCLCVCMCVCVCVCVCTCVFMNLCLCGWVGSGLGLIYCRPNIACVIGR